MNSFEAHKEAKENTIDKGRDAAAEILIHGINSMVGLSEGEVGFYELKSTGLGYYQLVQVEKKGGEA